MKNSEYWQERFKQMEEAEHDTSVQKVQEIQEQFERALAAINGKINAWYQRLANNNGVSMQEARKLLDQKELKEFHWNVEDYIKYAEENAISGAWEKQLENASARVHISRLEALKIDTQQEMEKLYGNCIDAVDNHISNLYTSDFYHTAYEVQKGIGIGTSMNRLDPNMVEKIVRKPWAVDGKNFSDRLWENKTKLINNVHNSLTRMCITGESPDRAINEIAGQMKVSKAQAGRVVMTESAAFANQAREDAMKELDVEQFEVVETLDSHTCELCGSMDGKHFPMSEYQIGVTAPPFHPNCRGCTCPYFGDEFDNMGERAARGEDGKTYYVPADTTYEEWKKSFVDDNKAKLREISESGITNKRTPKQNEYKINREVIDSNEYKKKFNGITNKSKVDEAIHKYAKAALYHRDGTNREDLYILSNSTGDILGKNITSTEPFGVSINDSVRKAIINHQGDLIGMHTHFDDTPPTGSDFETAFKRRYNLGVVVNATGDVYLYGCGNQYISAKLIDDTIEKYIKLVDENGEKIYTTTKEAHLQALSQLGKDYGIWYEAR